MGTSSLITDQHKTSINDSIAKLNAAKKEIEMAKRAGLTTGPDGQKLADAEEQVNSLLGRLTTIRNVYFPNG